MGTQSVGRYGARADDPGGDHGRARQRPGDRDTVHAIREHRAARLLAAQFTSLIILILAAATVLSIWLGDVTDADIIPAIIVASVLLGALAGPRRPVRRRRVASPGSGRSGDAAR
jgi:magnesium-transporting ATPase (P-type)